MFCRPENFQKLRIIDVLCIVIIMVIVVAIPATIFLYVHSDHVMVKTPKVQPRIGTTVYDGGGARQEFRSSDRTVNLQATRRSLNTGLVQDNYLVTMMLSGNRKPTDIVRSDTVKDIRYPANHRNDNDVNNNQYRFADGYETFFMMCSVFEVL